MCEHIARYCFFHCHTPSSHAQHIPPPFLHARRDVWLSCIMTNNGSRFDYKMKLPDQTGIEHYAVAQATLHSLETAIRLAFERMPSCALALTSVSLTSAGRSWALHPAITFPTLSRNIWRRRTPTGSPSLFKRRRRRGAKCVHRGFRRTWSLRRSARWSSRRCVFLPFLTPSYLYPFSHPFLHTYTTGTPIFFNSGHLPQHLLLREPIVGVLD